MSLSRSEESAPATPDTLRTASTAAWPRITLVTPVFNSVRYIEQTIRSVLCQGYPNLEYIIVDGGSTDGTVDIIRKYEKDISLWISEPDQGMFDAINKGFGLMSGEVMGWINASDQLHVGGLFVVGCVFRTFQEVEWITGRPTVFDALGSTVTVCALQRYSRPRLLAGINPVIQQESTFWRRSLWQRAGGYIDASHRGCSDWELWLRFFRNAKLYQVGALIGGYRGHEDALSRKDFSFRHVHEVLEKELDSVPWGRVLRAFRSLNNTIERIPKVRVLWRRIVMQPLARMPGFDAAPMILPRDNQWIMH